MVDIEELKDYDLSRGVFDLYVDDIIMPVEKIIALLEKDIVRLSQIDPYSVEDKEVFSYIDSTTKFLKSVIDDVFKNEGISSNIKTIDGYARKLVECVRENQFVVSKISEDKFKQNDLIESILVRDILARFNKFEKDAVESKMSRDEHDEGVYKFQVEYQKLEDIIEAKKAKKVFRNNLNIKPIE